MIETLTIALWAHLFCGPWSDAGKVFGWLKSWASKTLPEWAYTPLIGCSMCHAVWVALAFHAYRAFLGVWFDFGSALMVLVASFLAWLLDDFAAWRDKQLNA